MNRSKYMGILLALLIIVSLGLQVSADHLLLEPTGHLGVRKNLDVQKSAFALKFDISEIPDGMYIDLAELRLQLDTDTTLGKNISMIVHPAHSAWNASALPSQSKPATSDTMFVNNFVPTGDDKSLEVNVTELVRLWQNGALDNNGFVLSVRNNDEKKVSLRESGGSFEAVLSIHYSKE